MLKLSNVSTPDNFDMLFRQCPQQVVAIGVAIAIPFVVPCSIFADLLASEHSSQYLFDESAVGV